MNLPVLSSDDDLLLCERNLDSTVLKQNERCIELCGNQVGQECRMGCMEQLKNESPSLQLRRGFHSLPRRKIAGKLFEGLILKTKNGLSTMLYSAADTDWKEQQLQDSLTPTETRILDLRISHGLTNSEICKTLGCKMSTLKTHIFRINRKIKKNNIA